MDITEVETAIRNWVITSGFSGEVIFAYPNAERPTESYVLLNVMTTPVLSEPNYDLFEKEDQTIERTTKVLKKAVVSVNVYYAEAFHKAELIRDSIDNIDVQELITSSGLGFIDATPVEKIPEEINKKWEERAHFDIEFSFISEQVEIIDQIQNIQLNGVWLK